MRAIILLALSVSILISSGCSRMSNVGPKLVLAKDKQTEYVIVSPASPTPDETTAIA